MSSVEATLRSAIAALERPGLFLTPFELKRRVLDLRLLRHLLTIAQHWNPPEPIPDRQDNLEEERDCSSPRQLYDRDPHRRPDACFSTHPY